MAYRRRGGEGFPEADQASAHTTARAWRQERERPPRAGVTLEREAGPGGGAGLAAEAVARVAAGPEASDWEKAEPGTQAAAAEGAAAPALLGPLRLVPLRELGVRGPWRGRGFLLQKKCSVLWKVRCGCTENSG